MTPPRVLFVLKYRQTPYAEGDQAWGEAAYPGRPLDSGIYNSARMSAHMLERLGAATAVVHVVDANSIHREALAFEATHVVVEAYWVTPEKFDELGLVMPGVRFIVRCHSEAPFLANEGIGFAWSLEYLKRPHVQVAPNAPRMLGEMRFLALRQDPGETPGWAAERVPYLPNYYVLREEPPRPLDASKIHVDVGCFGAVRPLKNPIEQALAALKFAQGLNRPLRFHVNAGRVENAGDSVLKSLRSIFAHDPTARLVEHPWRTHDEFLSILLGMDLVCQVSFTETFNIVAADALAEGVPLVTSSEVPWSTWEMQADPTSSDDIAQAMAFVYQHKLRCPAEDLGREGLRAYNAASRDAWREVFFPVTEVAAPPPRPKRSLMRRLLRL